MSPGLQGLYIPCHCCLLLPQCLGDSGQSHTRHEGWAKLPELSAGHLSRGELAAAAAAVSEAGVSRSQSSNRASVSPGVLLRGHPPLLRPHHPVCHSLEVLLSASCWPRPDGYTSPWVQMSAQGSALSCAVAALPCRTMLLFTCLSAFVLLYGHHYVFDQDRK